MVLVPSNAPRHTTLRPLGPSPWPRRVTAMRNPWGLRRQGISGAGVAGSASSKTEPAWEEVSSRAPTHTLLTSSEFIWIPWISVNLGKSNNANQAMFFH